MIFNVQTGCKKKVSCKFLGAPGEKFTLVRNGKAAYSNISENTSAEIKQGTYTITGSISGHSKIVTVKEAGTYKAYPDGAVYWYGREVYSISVAKDGETGSYSTSAKAEKQTNRILLYVKTRGYAGSKYFAQMVTSSAVNTSGYSEINIKTSTQTAGSKKYSLTGGTKSGTTVGEFGTDISVGTVSVASPGTSKNIGCTVSASTNGDETYSELGVYVHAIWLSKAGGNTFSSTKTVAINSTYRHCNALYTSDFVRVGSLGDSLSGINYVGQGTEDYNAMMIPVSAFNYVGTVKELAMTLHLWCSSSSNHTFRWAVTTSRDNESLYKSYGAVTDKNQIGQGTFTPDYNNGAFADQTFVLDCENVPSGAPLYIYLWRDNTSYGNIHVTGNVKVKMTHET